LIASGEAIRIPPGVGRVHYEGEVTFQVGRRASHVAEADAVSYLSAVLPLNDVTARDLQNLDNQWTRAKGFDTFCAVGSPVPLDGIDISSLRVETRVNGDLRQEGRFSDVVFPIEVLVTYISRIMTLEPGDLIATGTPAGVGTLVPSDEVEVSIPGVGSVKNPVRKGSGRPWSYGGEGDRA
jgi:2-keto-4-pentenoate hydratase/2-oxohepta-3-ene-1,7-dioic acid hydratase in catechol pathway